MIRTRPASRGCGEPLARRAEAWPGASTPAALPHRQNIAPAADVNDAIDALRVRA